jgi:hypothetical protein
VAPASNPARGYTRVVSRTYTREEADEILRRALQQQATDGVSHDDLVAAAREVGIPGEAIEAAAEHMGERRVVEERVQLLRARKRSAFLRHLLIYAIVNTGIFLIDNIDGPPWYFHWPLIIWGIFMLLAGLRQLAPDREGLVRRAERELEKERKKEEKRRQRAQRAYARAQGIRNPSEGASEFEAAVEEGVSSLLSAAARAIRGLTPDNQRYRVENPPRPPENEPPTHESDARRRSRRA